MSRPRLYLALIVLLVVTKIARVARADPAHDLRTAMTAHATALGHLRSKVADGLDPRRDALTCELAIRTARAAKVPETFELTSPGFAILARSYTDARGVHLRLADASSLCDELGRWHELAAAHLGLREAFATRARIAAIDLATVDEATANELAATARLCKSRVETAIVLGFDPRTVLTVGGKPVALADATHAICEPLAAIARDLDTRAARARDQREARRAAPYTAIGIGGDRLELLVEMHGKPLYGVDGVELSTPASLKRARVIFHVEQRGDIHYLHRAQFDGDRLVRTTSIPYDRAPGRSAFR